MYREIDYFVSDNSDRVITRLSPYEAITIVCLRKGYGTEANPILINVENIPRNTFTPSTVVAYAEVDAIPDLNTNMVYRPMGITASNINDITVIPRYDSSLTQLEYWDYYPETNRLKLIVDNTTAPNNLAIIIYRPTTITAYQDLKPQWDPYIKFGHYILEEDYVYYPQAVIQDQEEAMVESVIKLHDINLEKFYSNQIYGATDLDDLFDRIIDQSSLVNLIIAPNDISKRVAIIVGHKWELDSDYVAPDWNGIPILDIMSNTMDTTTLLGLGTANTIIDEMGNTILDLSTNIEAGYTATSACIGNNNKQITCTAIGGHAVNALFVLNFNEDNSGIITWIDNRLKYTADTALTSCMKINEEIHTLTDTDLLLELAPIQASIRLDYTHTLSGLDQFSTPQEIESSDYIIYTTTITDADYYKDSLFILVDCQHNSSHGIPLSNPSEPPICFVAEFHRQNNYFVNVGIQYLPECLSVSRLTFRNDSMYIVCTTLDESGTVVSTILKYDVLTPKHYLKQVGDYVVKEVVKTDINGFANLAFSNTTLLYTDPSVGYYEKTDGVYWFDYPDMEIAVYYIINNSFKVASESTVGGNYIYNLIFSNPQTVFGILQWYSDDKSTEINTDPLYSGLRYSYLVGHKEHNMVTNRINLSISSNTLGDTIIVRGTLLSDDTFVSHRIVDLSLYSIDATYNITNIPHGDVSIAETRSLVGQTDEYGTFVFSIDTSLFSEDNHYIVVAHCDDVVSYSLIFSNGASAPVISVAMYTAINNYFNLG